MSTNRDLLKEAIADAKAVKETALANAKAALEEAFTPQIKSMLAAQILAEEEEELEEDEIAEADKVREEMEKAKEMEEGYDKAGELEEEFNLEEILAELELEEEDNETMKEETSEPHGNIGANTPEGEPLGFLDEEINLDEMDEDELKALIEDVIEDMIESGELEAGGDPVEFSDEEEDEEEGGEEMDMEMDAEEEDKDPVEEAIYGGPVTDDIATMLLALGIAGPIVASIVAAGAEKGAEKLSDWIKTKKPALKMLIPTITDTFKRLVGKKEKNPPSTPPVSETTQELEEALKTVKILKQELSEVNLLNSKLLYVNKIFRNKNLTESQKVKVLSAFDKATSVRETKIIYETLNEGLVSKTTTKSSIKESLGMASKPAGVAPKQPIVESDQMVQRFQKLAGIL